MGTVPYNFPPTSVMQIGSTIVGVKLGATASFPATVFFTAPTTGVYNVATYTRFIATDGAGTVQLTLTFPHSVTLTVGLVTPGMDKDTNVAARTTWMNAGETVTVSCSAVGLGATVYNVYMPVYRIF